MNDSIRKLDLLVGVHASKKSDGLMNEKVDGVMVQVSTTAGIFTLTSPFITVSDENAEQVITDAVNEIRNSEIMVKFL